MRNLAVAALAFVCLGGVGLAQEEKKKNPPQNAQAQPAALHVRFADLDANKDGKVTKGELEAFFARLDADQDGGILPAEFNAAAAAAPGCTGTGNAPPPPKKK